MNISETYFLKALENYPYNLEEVIENLNYSLSYDDGYAPALCLKAKVYAWSIKNFELAEEFFTLAISNDLNYEEAYTSYAEFLLNLGESEKAVKLLYHALGLKSNNRAGILILLAKSSERAEDLNNALKFLDKACKCSFSAETDNIIAAETERIKKKLKKKGKKDIKEKKSSLYWIRTFS